MKNNVRASEAMWLSNWTTVEEVGLSQKVRLKEWGVLPNLGRPAENNLSTEVIWLVSQNRNPWFQRERLSYLPIATDCLCQFRQIVLSRLLLPPAVLREVTELIACVIYRRAREEWEKGSSFGGKERVDSVNTAMICRLLAMKKREESVRNVIIIAAIVIVWISHSLYLVVWNARPGHLHELEPHYDFQHAGSCRECDGVGCDFDLHLR